MDKLDTIYNAQRAYQLRRDLFVGKDSAKETRDLALGLYEEIGELIRCVSWKAHRGVKNEIIFSNLKQELIDILKYWLILANVWGFSTKDIVDEFFLKSDVVEQRWLQEFQLKLADDKCICIDLDGVLCDYVGTWLEFLKRKNVKAIYDRSKYNTLDLSLMLENPLDYVDLKNEFRESGIKANALLMPYAKDFLDAFRLHYKIVIVSSRPYNHYRRIFSDTIVWMNTNNLHFDAIIFEESKREWVIKNAPNVIFCVDDDPKQIQTLANNGIKTYSILASYNKGIQNGNVTNVKTLRDIIEIERENENTPN